jgi:hypothetical protein
MDDLRFAICGAPASARDLTALGGPRWLCRDQMAAEPVQVLCAAHATLW